MTRARDQLDEGGVVSMGVGRPVRLGTRHGVLPGQVKTNRVGSVFLCAANASLVLLVVTYLALRPSGSGEQQGRHSVLLQAVGSDRSGVQPNRPQGRDGEAAPGGGSSTAVAGVHRASVAAMAAAGAKAGAVMWADMQRVAASKARQQQQQQQRRPRAHAPAGERQLHLQALACGTCAYKDNPLSEIDEPNVFPGPSEFGPDSPSPLGPLGNALDSACCAGTGGNAFGAPELSVADMRKVYELGEPNFKTWKEYEKAHNVFPGLRSFVCLQGSVCVHVCTSADIEIHAADADNRATAHRHCRLGPRLTKGVQCAVRDEGAVRRPRGHYRARGFR